MALIYTHGLTSTSYTSGPTTAGWDPTSYIYGGPITISESGKVTSLGVRLSSIGGAGSMTIKVALFDSSGNFVTGANGTVTLPESGDGWYDIDQTLDISVTTATYYVMYSASNANGAIYYNTGYSGSYATQAHASFPANATLSHDDSGYGYAGRVDFTAGGITANGTPAIGSLTASGVVTKTGSVAVTDVNTNETWDDGDTGLNITGTGFV